MKQTTKDLESAENSIIDLQTKEGKTIFDK